ncbi:MAG: hypothetical protein QM730_29645 [Anaerolineales bacterium]
MAGSVPGTGIPLLSTLSGADVAGATVGSRSPTTSQPQDQY